ncbi:hypothetical protein C2R22_18700 [Salinigranum rubrum]|uniref:Uncharacterized protein n=1 Tax=Salinigranum rubrum TaxID=755307 RepID=A0A2I8VNB0_9EURY|nr:hypothetical protein [Salinigranum rubrum]AUV83422.1 hypothetical protein C2R22_18700 [Salinigranum rubrum]
MQTGAVPALALATLLLCAGCLGAPSGTPVPDGSAEATPTGTATTPTPTAKPTPTPTPTSLDSLPSPARCLTDAVPRLRAVDGVEPSTYPEPPAEQTREAVVGWVQAFEIAYFRNAMLVDAAGDEENLTRVSASAEVRAVNRTPEGYAVRLSDFGATNYASGIHGDHWADVGYVVTETRLVRVPLDDRSDPVRASAGTVVVGCE